jgi:hypothetical protein
MLLAVYGMDTGTTAIPIHIRLAMSLSYLRYGFEGLIVAIYGNGRGKLVCPPEEIICPINSPRELLRQTGKNKRSASSVFQRTKTGTYNELIFNFFYIGDENILVKSTIIFRIIQETASSSAYSLASISVQADLVDWLVGPTTVTLSPHSVQTILTCGRGVQRGSVKPPSS